MDYSWISRKDLPKSVKWWWSYWNEKLEYADNFRAARLLNQKEVEEYNRALKIGCCGFQGAIVEGDEGEFWLVGCNYGH